MPIKPNREEALLLLKEYIKSDALLKHAYAVEGTMRHFAKLLGESDIEKWGVIGLLHDMDYELYPDEHCVKVQEILKEKDIDPEYIRAIASHAWQMRVDIEPIHQMEKVLYTIDELTGLINAAAIMRPSKSVLDIEVKSVKKKYKDSKFAAGVSREVIENGCKMLNMELDYVIEQVILGMREVAEAIGLVGTPELS